MQMHPWTNAAPAAFAAAVAAGLLACAAQVPVREAEEGLPRLVALSAARLALSRQVAVAKWDTREPVADPPGDPREQQVIDAAVREAIARGLAAHTASTFFADQIEASKLVQFALMADWRRAGGVPAGSREDLRGALRPALDRLRPQLIEALVATRTARAQPDCPRRLAQATAAYARSRRLPPLDAIALDRGLARVCAQ